MIWDKWPQYWQSGIDACIAHGSTREDKKIRDLKIAPPATEARVREVEEQLGQRLPESLRSVFLNFSAAVDYRCSLPDNVSAPDVLGWIFACSCNWDLELMLEHEEGRKGWVEHCFPNIDDPYDAIWHNKLAFMHIPNGDYLAIDVAIEGKAPVVYLSHDGADEHGYILGDDFEDFINRWSLLGCPGPEFWQIFPFITSPTSGLEPYGENAKLWREWFGLKKSNRACQ